MGHLTSLKMAPFDRPNTSSYWCSTVTTALYCIISEIILDIGRKSRCSIPYCILRSLSEYRRNVCEGKARIIALSDGEKFENVFTRLDTGTLKQQTDRHRTTEYAVLCIASRGKNTSTQTVEQLREAMEAVASGRHWKGGAACRQQCFFYFV